MVLNMSYAPPTLPTTFARGTLEHINDAGAIRVIADESMAPGGCRVETDRTVVDASLETQVDEIVTLLLGERTNDD